MECYPATKKNEIMPFAATCTDPEIFILSQRHTFYDATYMYKLNR